LGPLTEMLRSFTRFLRSLHVNLGPLQGDLEVLQLNLGSLQANLEVFQGGARDRNSNVERRRAQFASLTELAYLPDCGLGMLSSYSTDV
jgi:hypothetical protein